jgi:hypothetical protein
MPTRRLGCGDPRKAAHRMMTFASRAGALPRTDTEAPMIDVLMTRPWDHE